MNEKKMQSESDVSKTTKRRRLVEVIDVTSHANTQMGRLKAEEKTGKKQPSDGYCHHYRDVHDWEKYIDEKTKQGLLGERDATDEEKEMLAEFASASAVLSGHGHPFFASTSISVEMKNLVLVAIKTLANVLLLGDNHAFNVQHYFPMTDPSHASVIVDSFTRLAHLVNSCSDADWDFWNSEYYFDMALEANKGKEQHERMFGTNKTVRYEEVEDE